MMRQMNPEFSPSQEVQLEFNPRHALIHRLEATRAEKPELAGLIAEQMLEKVVRAR